MIDLYLESFRMLCTLHTLCSSEIKEQVSDAFIFISGKGVASKNCHGVENTSHLLVAAAPCLLDSTSFISR